MPPKCIKSKFIRIHLISQKDVSIFNKRGEPQMRKIAFVISAWLFIQAACVHSQPVIIQRTYFNPEHPELIDSLYQNLAHNVYVDIQAAEPDSGCYTTVFWAISSLGSDPIYPTFQVWHLTADHSNLEHLGGFFRLSGWQHHIMIFGEQGEFVFSFGLVRDLPWEFTPEELWNNMDALGCYDQDTLTFGGRVPDAEIQIPQACPWNWLPVIDGYIVALVNPITMISKSRSRRFSDQKIRRRATYCAGC